MKTLQQIITEMRAAAATKFPQWSQTAKWADELDSLASADTLAWHFEFNNGEERLTRNKHEAENIRRYLEADETETVFYAAPQKRIAELEALLQECRTTMNHAKVFIATREKMHPTGQELYRELLEQIDKALNGETR